MITSAVTDKSGKIYGIPGLEAVGMKAGIFFRLNRRELIELPYGSEIFMLPDRPAAGYERKTKTFVTLKDFFAAAAFVSPGYTITYNSAYSQNEDAKPLPLFSYGALAFYKNKFYVSAVRVDREKRQDLRLMDVGLVRKNVKKYRKIFPKNKLTRHLEGCALVYGCPAAKNFFLSRYECPLPTSPQCNSRCLGCISYQPDNKCSVTQPRIKFTPSAEEVAEAALFHIRRVKDPVVSFGQGCEGEPLLAHKVLADSIRLIRKKTSKGIINLNTNASRPKIIAELLDLGLDSIRVSLNSVRKKYYDLYYKPRGYEFKDVIASIRAAKRRKGFVSINYLTMPGFTDSKEEFNSLKALLETSKIDMIQWRNLNFDSLLYFKALKIMPLPQRMLGVRWIISEIKKLYPHLMMGYFNPSKGRIRARTNAAY